MIIFLKITLQIISLLSSMFTDLFIILLT